MNQYKTQMEAAKSGILTPEMKTVAKKESISPDKLREGVASGAIAIPCNIRHASISPEGIGMGLKTKINVNLGISGDCKNYDIEMQKVDLAIKYGAEAIMDLSNYGKTNTFRKELIKKSPAMIGTVPMYDAIGYLEKDLLDITAKDFLRVVTAHAEEGVDFMTIHAGINRRAVEAFRRDKRRMNIVSRGGSLLFAWMMMTGNENPFYEYYDEVLEILREYLIPEKRTVLFSTHITGDLERIADCIVYISNGAVSYCGDKEELTSSYCVVRGERLPEEKSAYAIGLRRSAVGYECLMALSHIGGLPADTVTEAAAIGDVIVYMERNGKYV